MLHITEHYYKGHKALSKSPHVHKEAKVCFGHKVRAEESKSSLAYQTDNCSMGLVPSHLRKE